MENFISVLLLGADHPSLLRQFLEIEHETFSMLLVVKKKLPFRENIATLKLHSNPSSQSVFFSTNNL